MSGTVIAAVGTAVAGLSGADGLLDPAPSADTAADAAADGPWAPGAKGMRYKDEATRLALAAAADALTRAGLLRSAGPGDPGPSVPGDAVATVVSSNYGGLETVCRAAAVIAENTVTGLSPMDLPNASSNVAASSVAIRFGLRGPNLTVCNGATSGLDAVEWGRRLIESGRARWAVVVGVEVADEAVRRLLGEPGRLFHGAAALVLASAEAAAEHGGRPLGRLGGYRRAASVARSVQPVAERPVDLWLVPERHDGAGGPRDGDRTAVVDLSGQWGPASGALGVLQCAAATAWFARGRGPAALATAGTGADGDDASASLLLTAPGAGR
jgi:3-oxoacyl-[acyl-carrier-protein] synthase II